MARPVCLHGFAEDRLRYRRWPFNESEHAAKHRPQKHMRRNQGGDGVPGEAKHTLRANTAKEQGFARPHGDLGEVELEALGLECARHEVALAN